MSATAELVDGLDGRLFYVGFWTADGLFSVCRSFSCIGRARAFCGQCNYLWLREGGNDPNRPSRERPYVVLRRDQIDRLPAIIV
jgi:hypothetical protein